MMFAAHEANLSCESWCRPGSRAAYYLFQFEEWGSWFEPTVDSNRCTRACVGEV
jgi:hypothetical protein